MLVEKELEEKEEDVVEDTLTPSNEERDFKQLGIWGPVLDCIGRKFLMSPPSVLVTGSVLIAELPLLIRESSTAWAYERVMAFLTQALQARRSRLAASTCLRRLVYSCRKKIHRKAWGQREEEATHQILALILTLSQGHELLKVRSIIAW